MLGADADSQRWRRIVFIALLPACLLVACTASSDDPAAPAEAPTVQADSATSASLSGSAPAVSYSRSVAQRVDDAVLAAQIQQALLDTAALRPFVLELDVQEGRVALRGSVHTEEDRRLAASVTREVAGVEHLVNEIVVNDTTRATSDTASDSSKNKARPGSSSTGLQ